MHFPFSSIWNRVSSIRWALNAYSAFFLLSIPFRLARLFTKIAQLSICFTFSVLLFHQTRYFAIFSIVSLMEQSSFCHPTHGHSLRIPFYRSNIRFGSWDKLMSYENVSNWNRIETDAIETDKRESMSPLWIGQIQNKQKISIRNANRRAHKPHTQKIAKTLCVFVVKEAESTWARALQAKANREKIPLTFTGLWKKWWMFLSANEWRK